MTEFTLQELADLEEKAIAGDKNARETLDRMAQEEGFTDWESQEKECNRIMQPVLLKAMEAVDRERARREKTPGMKPVMTLARMMMESKNPAHRALIGTYPHRNLYAAAKKFEEEAAKEMSVPATDPGQDILPRPNGFEIFADNTAGTALYKRNEQGIISDVKPMPNPGWAFEVSQKSITCKPEQNAIWQAQSINVGAAQVGAGKAESEREDTTGWDTTLIEMWNKGHSRDEIAQRVNVSKDRVTNRITELRTKFGKKIVPYNKDRRKLLIKS